MITLLSVNVQFGIVTILPSNVLILVLLRPTSSTVPSCPSIFILSLILNGLSKKIIIPANIFLTESWAARASANPPIPSPAIMAVISKPILSNPITIPRDQIIALTAF